MAHRIAMVTVMVWALLSHGVLLFGTTHCPCYITLTRRSPSTFYTLRNRSPIRCRSKIDVSGPGIAVVFLEGVANTNANGERQTSSWILPPGMSIRVLSNAGTHNHQTQFVAESRLLARETLCD
jgi:hypothetical protein